MSELSPVVFDLVVSDFTHAKRRGDTAVMEQIIGAVGEDNFLLLAYTAIRLQERGVNVVYTTPNMEIDTTPGTGRYVTRGTGLSNDEQAALLRKYAPKVNTLEASSISGLEGSSSQIRLPFVLKNTWDQRGRNKILVETEEQLEKLVEWADLYKEEIEASEGFYTEPFIEGYEGFMHSYRLTAIASGLIVAATFKYSRPSREQAPFVDNPILRPLIDPNSPLFLNTHAITSNAATGGESIALSTPNHSVLGDLDSTQREVLSIHGISNRQVPEEVFDAGVSTAKVVGPSQALLTGIDFVQGRDGEIHFLESNSSPSLNNVRRTVGQDKSDLDIYLAAADRFAMMMA